MKKKTIAKEFSVYQIIIDGVTVYIGYTNNIQRRTREHINLYKKVLQAKLETKEDRRGIKALYLYLREQHIKPEDINLDVIKVFNTRAQGKRFECYTILDYYFNKEWTLKQRVPIINDMVK